MRNFIGNIRLLKDYSTENMVKKAVRENMEVISDIVVGRLKD